MWQTTHTANTEYVLSVNRTAAAMVAISWNTMTRTYTCRMTARMESNVNCNGRLWVIERDGMNRAGVVRMLEWAQKSNWTELNCFKRNAINLANVRAKCFGSVLNRIAYGTKWIEKQISRTLSLLFPPNQMVMNQNVARGILQMVRSCFWCQREFEVKFDKTKQNFMKMGCCNGILNCSFKFFSTSIIMAMNRWVLFKMMSQCIRSTCVNFYIQYVIFECGAHNLNHTCTYGKITASLKHIHANAHAYIGLWNTCSSSSWIRRMCF